MKSPCLTGIALCLGLVAGCWLSAVRAGAAEPAPGRLLWEIGNRDGKNAEFALAPKEYQKYAEDPMFIVGVSEPRRDWPYVHPGPTDAWAGQRRHTFAVVFSIKQKPEKGECRLLVDLIDTQSRVPPQLAIGLNGRQVALQQMPAGAGDDSVFGDPAKGRKHAFTVSIPAASLAAGINEITIESLSGSWVLYDWLGLEAPPGVELGTVERATLVSAAHSPPLLVEKDGKLCQTVAVSVVHLGPPAQAKFLVNGAAPYAAALKTGKQTVEVPVPAVEKESAATVDILVGEKNLASRQVTLRPVRKWTVYLLPHSHVDIGYTQVQDVVEQSHWKFFEQAIEASRRTADYAPGAQFKWNVEVLWAVDSYLKQAPPEKRREFIDAVKKGWIGLDALYGNELTALCRPEELMRLVGYAQTLSRRCGVKIDSAMISDVPGYTWGLMSVFGQAGVKYMSIGPNGGDRIGYTLEAWANKPFYWLSPDGRHKVLCWIPKKGYWQAFQGGPQLLEHLRGLEDSGYPYDMEQIRYCLGDNAGPGLNLCETVQQWNTKYAYPKLVIATTSPMMREFEKRWGDKVPEVTGDFTPYWEDGAASSAYETAVARKSAEQLSQAEALWAMIAPGHYPAERFYLGWRNVILYDEHTWGAHNSISEPDKEFVLKQWAIKGNFSREAWGEATLATLLATSRYSKEAANSRDTLLVFNTSSWPRTEVVDVPSPQEVAGDLVQDAESKPVPSQRLADGRLVFLARDVPPFGARRFTVRPGKAAATGSAKAEANRIGNSLLSVTVDEKTGAIASLKLKGLEADLVDSRSAMGLNDYFYVPGKNPADAQRCGPVKISVHDRGPLVASLVVESTAPGCEALIREVSVADAADFAALSNLVVKKPIRTKEGVHFAFPFNVPDGVMRMDIPWAVARPEQDQMPGSCKNWFTVQRWVDVSNDKYGVTWATVDAPMVEVGAITAETPWIKTLKPSQTLYSYVMNNYWHTNYKADQEGPTIFRYALRAHAGAYQAIDAARFGIERSQAMLVVPAGADAPAVIPSRLQLEPNDVAVATVKPSNDRKAIVVRLFGASGKAGKVGLKWSEPAPKSLRLSNLGEEPLQEMSGPIEVPAMGIVTLRAELAE